MCGFAGFIELEHDAGPAERRATLERMEAQIAHRGPDDAQFYDDGVLALVFRRLAIVGLGNGRQPIPNEDGSLLVVVNGEIYNHKDLRHELATRHLFRTASDSEVALHLFEDLGPRAVERLVGKFALALWDHGRRRLFLARDRMGVKPLYFAPVPRGLIFGSELKALLAHPRCPRQVAWEDVQATNWSLSSFVRGVRHLPGGHYAVWTPEVEAAPVRYWDLAAHLAAPDAPSRPDSDYVEELTSLFESAVRDRLMSEVPVGAFLSGGLDSSAVVAATVQCGAAPSCFTIVERNSTLCGDAAAAEGLARTLGLAFHPVLFDLEQLPEQLEFSLESFEYFVWLMDSPRFHQEWLLKHELHRFAKGVIPDQKVMLLGQGADEFAGGYSNPLSTAGANDWGVYLGTLERAEIGLSHTDAGLPARVTPFLSDFYRPALSADAPVRETYQREMLFRATALQRFNLWHEDRTAASQGVESRVPYLDHRIVELLASVPTALHPTLFWDKRIMREMSRRWLPDAYATRRKVAFLSTTENVSAPRLDTLLARRIYPAFRESYLDAPDSILSAEAMDAEQSKLGGVDANTAARLLRLMAIAVFERQCQRAATAPPPTPPRHASPLQELRDVASAPWPSPPAA
jgi:asparagine synthase (glutamine-hydrolysing)